ncbi:MAG: hypothetical protein FD134_1884 [Gallionellaceae bacterium]|nr:MAG: hypothetical protein FD134_1884 [Gallionellaceae bacterium]
MKSNFDEKAAVRLGKNKNTSAFVLKTIAGKSDKVDKLIAKHPNADAKVLGRLSGSLDIKTFELLLLNPNTPFKTILTIASSLNSGKDRARAIGAIDAELEKLLTDEKAICYGKDKVIVAEPEILPPGVQRTYRVPNSAPIVRELLRGYLKNSAHEQLAIQMARDKKTPTDRLDVLCGINVSIDRLIAKLSFANGNWYANKRILEKLSESKDKTTRRNVFLNLQTEGHVVIKLASEFHEDFFKLKPQALDRLVNDSPECIYGINQTLLFQILMHQECPQILLDWAYKHGGAYEQLAVWKNPQAPVELLTKMIETGYPQEANVLLAHPAKIIEYVSDLGLTDAPPRSYEELCDYGGWLRNTGDGVSDLWNKLVPKQGEAETVQGELVRAMGRIENDYYRNGFGNWLQCYGLSQFLADHLADENTFKPFAVSVIRADIRALHSRGLRCIYEGDLERTFLESVNYMEEIFLRINAAIAVWCKRHRELIPYKQSG